MLILFEDAKLKHQFKIFRKTGAIPDAIYAGQINRSFKNDESLTQWAKYLLNREETESLTILLQNLHTCHSQFKLPYTLSHYKKGINPIIALYEDFQKALFSTDNNKFDLWIIDFCKSNIQAIISALHNDIDIITNFVQRYKKADKLPFLNNLLSKFKDYLTVFNCYV